MRVILGAVALTAAMAVSGRIYSQCITCLGSSNNGRCGDSCASTNSSGAACCGNKCNNCIAPEVK
jgi:hypothetical protein